MSWDFPDGPDYNPEPIDDDPWDVPERHSDDPSEASETPLSDDDPDPRPTTHPETQKGSQR